MKGIVNQAVVLESIVIHYWDADVLLEWFLDLYAYRTLSDRIYSGKFYIQQVWQLSADENELGFQNNLLTCVHLIFHITR